MPSPRSAWMVDQRARLEARDRRLARLQAALLILAVALTGIDLEPLLRWLVP